MQVKCTVEQLDEALEEAVDEECGTKTVEFVHL